MKTSLKLALTGTVAFFLLGGLFVSREAVHERIGRPQAVEAGVSGLEDLITRAGATSQVHRLTRGDGSLDIMIMASTDCSHCRAFESEGGLDYLVSMSREKGLDLGYFYYGTSGSNMVVGSLKNCAWQGETVALADISEAYRVAGGVRELMSREDRAEARVELDRVIDGYGAFLGLSTEDVRACRSDGAMEDYMEVQAAVRDITGVRSTPGFLVDRGNGEIVHTSGFGGVETLARNIERAMSGE